LAVDRNSRFAFVIFNNNDTIEKKTQEIKEGDSICMVENKWSLGGEIIPNDQYIPKTSEAVRLKLGGFLRPFTEEKNMKILPVKTQLHIAKLIRSMKEIGWEP